MSPLSPERTPQRSRSWIRAMFRLTLPIQPVTLAQYMTVFLVRHADAKSRANWPHPDDTRPLSRKGLHQAEALVDRLVDRPVRRVLSSPAVRCVETLAPLAGKLGLSVQQTESLLEGASTAK